MSAKHLMGINLNTCPCGQDPLRCSEFASGALLYWAMCPDCGRHTAKSDLEADADAAWNDGETFPLALALAAGPAPARSLPITPPAPAA